MGCISICVGSVVVGMIFFLSLPGVWLAVSLLTKTQPHAAYLFLCLRDMERGQFTQLIPGHFEEISDLLDFIRVPVVGSVEMGLEYAPWPAQMVG